MKKSLIVLLSFIGGFSGFSALSQGTNTAICGQWDLKGEGIYDGFVLSQGKKATILSIEKLKSSYYMQGNMIHIPHNRGGEFLLELRQRKDKEILIGQDFWTKGSVYEKNPKKSCQ
ncbi:MAG: hypothetical protein ACK5MJ_08365 [Alphaproteobacteria bacterium]